MTQNLKQKDLALITSLILHEDILGGTIFQTFDKAYSIAEKFQYIYPPDFKWEGEDLEFDEAIIKFAKSELEKEERIKEKEYYMKIGNTSGTID
tara:strand:- start:10 stop:291 length:282 start_codon:yes stop_codon:yes gene_type:complete